MWCREWMLTCIAAFATWICRIPMHGCTILFQHVWQNDRGIQGMLWFRITAFWIPKRLSPYWWYAHAPTQHMWLIADLACFLSSALEHTRKHAYLTFFLLRNSSCTTLGCVFVKWILFYFERRNIQFKNHTIKQPFSIVLLESKPINF